MNLFKWFTPKNKKNVVIPVDTKVGKYEGIELIKKFTTEDEPKVVDFPKKDYLIYWETLVSPISGGYGALVRFYSFEDGRLIIEHQLSKITVEELKADVNKLILSTMNQNKR
jgi:hypothetical protein